LLHSYLVNFGLLVAGNKSVMLVDPTGRHGTMGSAKGEEGASIDAASKSEMRAYSDTMKLNDGRLLDYIREFQSPWSVTMQTIWPNLIVQRELNTLGVRHIVPQGPGEFTMIWTMFGYEGDSDEMRRHRLRQGNLMGPAGFLGLEDNEAMKFVQDGVRKSRDGAGIIELGGREEGTSTTLITEAAIRSMYRHWRGVMGL
jgi:anthranilate 1,2-dioxygenase large subunit